MSFHTNIKMLALDIDGTIMNKQFQISENVKNAISKAQNAGVKVVIATGRMHSATVPIAKALNITTPLVTYQGSLIKEYKTSDKTLIHYQIEHNHAVMILDELKNKQLQANVYLNDELFVENETPIVKEYAEKRYIPCNKVDSFAKMKDFKPTKILVIDESPDKIGAITDYLEKKYNNILNIERSTPIYCEIVNKKASKGNALLYLAKIWGFDPSEIMAIGDHDNDIDMIKIAGIGIAMGNATEKMKQQANYITSSIDEDGTAKAIDKFIFGIDHE